MKKPKPTLKPHILDSIRVNDALLLKIATAVGLRVNSVYRWALYNSKKLVAPAVLAIIREETGLTDEEILEEVEPEKKKAVA